MSENQISVLQKPNESQPVRSTPSGADDPGREDARDSERAFDLAGAQLRHFSGNCLAVNDWPAVVDQAAR